MVQNNYHQKYARNLQNDVTFFIFGLRPQTKHDMADLQRIDAYTLQHIIAKVMDNCTQF